jgi:hypothetical protein
MMERGFSLTTTINTSLNGNPSKTLSNVNLQSGSSKQIMAWRSVSISFTAGQHLFVKTLLVAAVSLNLTNSTSSAAGHLNSRNNCAFIPDAGEPLHGILKRQTGRELSITVPQGYLSKPFPAQGKIGENGTLLLFVHRTNPSPYPMADMSGKLAKGIQDWIQLLLWDFRSLETIKNTALTTPVITKGYIDDLSYNGKDLVRLTSASGSSSNDVLVSGDSQHLRDVIVCSRRKVGMSNNPQCRHSTIINGIHSTFTYGRQYLSEWTAIKFNVRNLLSCLFVNKKK